jgi:hypothetical protein
MVTQASAAEKEGTLKMHEAGKVSPASGRPGSIRHSAILSDHRHGHGSGRHRGHDFVKPLVPFSDRE